MPRIHIGPNGETYAPTLKPYASFNAVADAEALRKAMKGIGTDEQTITDILGQRSYDQRIEIVKAYKSTLGRDLEADLKSELGGDFEKLVLALLRGPFEHYAYALYKAIQGAGTNESVLVQILGCATNEEIEHIKEAYQEVLRKHKKDTNTRNLEEDIKNDVGGYLGRVLIALVQGDRDEPSHADMETAVQKGSSILFNKEKAKEQAEKLYNAGEGKLGTDEEAFIAILCKNSVWQIAAINVAYESITTKSLLDAIKSELSGDLKTVMEFMLKSSLARSACYAEILHKAIACVGTDDDTLIRLVACRAEIDLGDIKQEYAREYGKSLAEDVKADTSGDYQKLLLTLIG